MYVCVYGISLSLTHTQDDLDPLVQLTKLHDQQSSIETGADQPTSNSTAASTAALEGPDTDTQVRLTVRYKHACIHTHTHTHTKTTPCMRRVCCS